MAGQPLAVIFNIPKAADSEPAAADQAPAERGPDRTAEPGPGVVDSAEDSER